MRGFQVQSIIEIAGTEIDTLAILKYVGDDAAGAIDIFIGTTRNISNKKKVLHLEFEAYVPMARKKMQEIEKEIRTKWNIIKFCIVHRTGKVRIGDTNVVIDVSSAHRRDAFEACRYAIDTLKKNVPIWKKEFFEDVEIWVDERN